MPKYVLTGVGGNIGSSAASYALEIAPPGSTLVFSTSNPNKIPKGARDIWLEKGETILQPATTM